MNFTNRLQAADVLANELEKFRRQRPVVLGVPRGAMPMARLIADRLGGELDLILVHKFGHPLNPEFALGAVTEEGNVYLGSGAERMGLDESDVARSARLEIEKLREKRRFYTPGRKPVRLEGRLVIIVDDGIATGATMTAAVKSAYDKGAHHVIVASPVASSDAVQRLESERAEVVALLVPDLFMAVSQFYEEFDQVEDEEVLLALASRHAASTESPRPNG